MRRPGGDADAVGAADRRRDREPFHRRAALLHLLRAVAVRGERERDLAGGDQAREQRVALSNREAVRAHDLAEDAQALFLAEVGDDHGEPVFVLGLDAQASLPTRLGEVGVGLRQLLLLHEPGVVRLDEQVDPAAYPVPVRAQRLRHQVLEVRRAQRLQRLLAIQRLELRAVGLDRVGFVASGARLGERALHHLLGIGAPALQLHAVLALERGCERRKVFGNERGVDHDLALLARALEEELLAVGLVVLHDLRQRDRRDQSEQEREDAEEVHAGIIESAHAGRYPSRSFPWRAGVRPNVQVGRALVPGAPRSPQAYRAAEPSCRVGEVVKGLERPWSLAFLPDGRMLATEKAGRLRMIANGRLEPQPIAGLPRVTVHGQGGLHDVVLHPQFEQNRLVYLAYAARGEDGVGTVLARGRLADGRLEEVQVLFRQSPKGRTGNHFGGRIVFDRAGYVYLTLGDPREMRRAQKPDDHAGPVIRRHDDGRVPDANPFVGKPGWKPEKFDLGHRNQQGAALHPQTGVLWTQRRA